MATRRFTRAASLLSAAALSITAIALVPGTGVAAPNLSIQEVQNRVDTLYAQAEVATEQAHAATVEVQLGKARLARINKQIASQQKTLDALSATIAKYASAMYANGGIDPSLQMMLSSNPGDFLSKAQALDQVMRTQNADLRRAETARLALAQTQAVANQQVAHLKDLRSKATAAKAAANSKLSEAQALLSRLKQKQRDQLAALQAQRAAAAQQASRNAVRSTPAPAPTSVAGSSRGAVAAAYAVAQVGKPYVFGASGPSVFDCSGLTMTAWAQAGVYLPHSASLQYSSTTRVDSGSLQPGDLVFFYSDIHHVGMYVGGGMFVHAANPTDGVMEESLFSSYWQSVYMGAGRP